MLNFANFLTLSRIVLTPIIIFFMVQQSWIVATFIFFLAVLTDLLDGWVARTFHQTSKFGRILDPIADKILFGSVMTALIVLLPYANLLFFSLCFLLVKESILLFGGAVLWFWYAKFIQPSPLSRMVSWCEFLLLFLIFFDHMLHNFVPVVVFFIVAIINILLSCKLLILYLRKVLNISDIS